MNLDERRKELNSVYGFDEDHLPRRLVDLKLTVGMHGMLGVESKTDIDERRALPREIKQVGLRTQ